MASPAPARAPEPEPDPDPLPSGSADIRRLMITDSRAVALAAAEVAARPGDENAAAMLGLTRQVMENAVEMARRLVLDEQTLERVRAEAYAEGMAAQCARCGRLRAVPPPR